MDEKWMQAYEADLLGTFAGEEYKYVGYISYAAARSIKSDAIELSWYPNIHDRFHEMKVTLPRSQFITCTEVRQYDEKPRVFVRGEWLNGLHLRPHSVFALVDAIGVRLALENGTLDNSRLVLLRERIDAIAGRYPTVAFVSFADSLLLKSNWFVGAWDSAVKYSYEPETIVRLLPEIQFVYREVLGMEIYAVIAQGINEYYEDRLLHISSTQNHVSLNSLGLPFAQLLEIDSAVRSAIRVGDHRPAEVYMDENFYHSLRFSHDFDKNHRPKSSYISKMSTGPNYYFFEDCQMLLANLRTNDAA